MEGFVIEGAHMMLYALAKEGNCCNDDFWQMLDILYAKGATNILFATGRWRASRPRMRPPP